MFRYNNIVRTPTILKMLKSEIALRATAELCFLNYIMY